MLLCILSVATRSPAWEVVPRPALGGVEMRGGRRGEDVDVAGVGAAAGVGAHRHASARRRR